MIGRKDPVSAGRTYEFRCQVTTLLARQTWQQLQHLVTTGNSWSQLMAHYMLHVSTLTTGRGGAAAAAHHLVEGQRAAQGERHQQGG